jgi:hypothetical protein
VSRIFLSHSSADQWSALALQQWLARNGWDDVFLDVDPVRGLVAGERWQEALRRAADRCEAVVFLVSPDWAKSTWCVAEFLLAKSLHKLIFGVIVKEVPIGALPVEMTSEWQLCRLVGAGAVENIAVERDGETVTVAFSDEGLSRLKVGLRNAGLGANYFTWPPADDERRSPYRGLEALGVQDAAVFFGRDAEILHGLDQLRGLRAQTEGAVFVILGPSGAGKSSFLRAGLLPRLARDDRHFFPLNVISPERGPLFGEAGLSRAIAEGNALLGLTPNTTGDVKAAIRSDAGSAQVLLMNLQSAAANRPPALADLPSPPTLVLAVDQAEQLFDAGISAESHSFLQQIGAIVRSGTKSSQRAQFIVVFTIRSDRYEPLQTSPELAGIPSFVFDRLRPMSPGQFKDVITGPAARVVTKGRGVTFEPALVNALLSESAKGADTLPLLSLALQRLYEDYGGNGVIRLEHYTATGGLSDITRSEVESVLSSNVSDRATQLDLLHAIFIPWLVTVNDDDEPMARVARVSELPHDSAPLVEALVRRRLLLRDLRGTDQVVQVAHESLLRHWGVLRDWLREDAEDLKEIDRLEQAAVAWTRSGKRAAWLITGERLRAAEALTKSPRYAARLRSVAEFVSTARHGERRSRIGQFSVGAAALVALALSAWIGLPGRTQPDQAPVQLRGTATELEETDITAFITARGMFERTRNPNGAAFPNRFRIGAWNDANVVIDDASRLIWQRGGSPRALSTAAAEEYVGRLNYELHAGFGDWRLPTLEEALSLMERTRRADGVHIDAIFDGAQRNLWTADRDGSGERWSVDFYNATVGIVADFGNPNAGFVRAVRSGVDRFWQIDTSSINNLPWNETGISFPKERDKPPMGITRRGVPFRLLGESKAVFITSANGLPRPTEATLEVNVPYPVSAHVLIAAGWLMEPFKNEKVGEIEYQFENGTITTDLIGWRTVREGWNAISEPLQDFVSNSVVLTNFHKEPQNRQLVPGKPGAPGEGIIDMLSTDFSDPASGALKRIVLRDTSTPKLWLDPRDNRTYNIDPGFAFMGITIKNRPPD